ncbi:MAG TPA: short-chain dehydrogenase [Chryseobacterium sp.]|nr:short-chain dehydrogenase [Chryseobacterium sp.]
MVETKVKNHWALILGGSSGLGLASAQKLALDGFNIIIVHRSPRSELTGIQKEFDVIRETGVRLIDFNKDALNPVQQESIVAEIRKEINPEGKINCLLHSIAKGNLKPMTGELALSTEDFAITLQAMATSFYDWVRLIFNACLFAQDARVLAFTSEGSSRPLPNYAAVSAAKAALEAMMRSIALEFAPHGIRANCIQAGVTDTWSLQMIPGSDEIKKITQNRNPFGRLTTPQDVANVVSLLCRPEAAWINGCVIPVDGGEHLC